MSTRRKVQPDAEAVARADRVAEIRAEEDAAVQAAVMDFIRGHLSQRLITVRLEVDELRAELDALRTPPTEKDD